MNTLLNIFYRLLDNAGYWTIHILTFLVTVLAIMGIYLLSIRKSHEEKRLEKLLPSSKIPLNANQSC